MKRFVIQAVLAVVAVGALAMLAPMLHVTAFNPQPDPPAFGLIGIDPSETVRLNAICADTPLPGGFPPGPCTLMLVFRDTSGRALTQMTATLQPGQGTSLDLNGTQTGARNGRMEVQPYVSPIGVGFVLCSVEVFDTFTRHTSAVLNPTEPRSLGPAGQ